MQLSDWQLARLRNAIRAYHNYERSHDGDFFTWKDVSEAIDEYTGVTVPPERLRQFVEGVKQKDGSFKHPVPSGERLKAIYDFATDTELNLLSVDELEERDIGIQVAMRLLDFLDHDLDRRPGYQRVGFPENFEGRYWCVHQEAPFVRHLELQFEKPLDACVAVVHLLERDFDEDNAPDPTDIFTAKWPDECESKARFSGWAILTPEDNIIIFLKEHGVGHNRYYLTLESELNRDNERRKPTFTLLHHDYPKEYVPLTPLNDNSRGVEEFIESRRRFVYKGR